MKDINSVILSGRLTHHPELKVLRRVGLVSYVERFEPGDVPLRDGSTTTTIVEFGLATNRRFKDRETGEWKEETCFVDVVAFGRKAELVNRYFTRGKPIVVIGRLRWQKWADSETGDWRKKHSIVLEDFKTPGNFLKSFIQRSDWRLLRAAGLATLHLWMAGFWR